jgi:uncharacterized membrane-anchored protein
VLVAGHAVLLPWDGTAPDDETLAARCFGGNVMVGSRIGGGAAAGFTDFRIHADGFSRIVVLDRSLTPNQAGRTVQRLFEIDAYRMLALLALPVARALSPSLARSEQELAQITTVLAGADESQEAGLLDRLTRLEAEIESQEADNHYRFSAASAYYDLVQRRIAELREERIPGLQTFEEFMERRLAPAMATCRSVAQRQESLSQRVSQATQLLSTRVGITRERQNQTLLESMDRRAALQLRLQSTVEGLSAAAVTYYVVGLVNYFAKGLNEFGIPVDAGLVTALSVPVVLLLVILAVRRIRRRLETRSGDHR